MFGLLPAQLDSGFVGPEIRWWALSPMLMLVGGALGLLVVGALTPRWPKWLYAIVSVVVAVVAGGLAMTQWDDITDEGVATLVGGAIAFDTFSMFMTITLCVAVVLSSLVTADSLRDTPNEGPEIYSLYLVAAVGGVVMASANDLIVMFLGLETLSLALYLLAASNRRSSQSGEAGIKYFVLGGFASAFFLYGIALVYGGTGTTNVGEMVAALSTTVTPFDDDTLVLAGVALMLVGFGFKVAAVPFHVWAPDVYQGSPSPVAGFMASTAKVAAFGGMIRVLVVALPFSRDDWRPVVWVLALLTLVLGSVLSVVQTNVKRMLAYSSISHAGFILVGVEAAGHHAGEADLGPGVPAVALYLLLYSVLVIGSFAVVTAVARDGSGETDLGAFRGLARRRPTLALAFTVFLLAQAGVPLTSGFIAKFGVITAAVDVESYAIAVIAMVSAVIAAFLYLKILVTMWAGEPDEGATAVRVPLPLGLAIGAAALFTLFVGIVPGWLIDATESLTTFAR